MTLPLHHILAVGLFITPALVAETIVPQNVVGTWVTDPADPRRSGELELILQADDERPDILRIKDATPVGTVYGGDYMVAGDTMSRLPNGREEDPYRQLSWRMQGDHFIVTYGGIWRPDAYVGTKLVRLLPDPFFDAVRNGDIATLNARSDLKDDVEKSVDQIGRTALYVATIKRQSKALRLLIATGAPIDLQNRNLWGDSALFAAVRRGDPECLAILLENGADVNQRSGNGRTPLMGAGETSGHYGLMLEILFEAGANPEATNAKGLTAREILVSAGADNFVRIFDEQLAAYRLRHPKAGT